MQRNNVDLPEPDAPIKTVAVCSGTASDKLLSTSSDPNDLRTLTSSKTLLIRSHLLNSERSYVA